MYPIDAEHLDFDTIAKRWAEALPGRPSIQDVQKTMLRDFWRGDLRAFTGAGRDQNTDARISILNACLFVGEHYGLLFLQPAAAVPPDTVQHPDGSVSLDLRKRAIWVETTGEPELALFEQACAVLAEAGFDDYADLVRPGLVGLEVRRADFADYCQRNGWPLPEFWFARRTTPSRARAETVCREWLRAQVRAGPKRMSKPEYREVAQREIPNLSERQFDRCWEDDRVVPKTWKRAGRLPNAVRKSSQAPR